MGQIRLELMTPALSERCSNQLSYCPKITEISEKRRYCMRADFLLKGLSPFGPTVLSVASVREDPRPCLSFLERR